MGFNVPLISFVPATKIRSAPVNSNFTALNTAPFFTGGVPTMNFDGGALTSDGSGNIKFNNGLGQHSKRDIFDWSSTSDTYIKATSGTGSITFQVGTPGSGNTTLSIMTITSAGITIVPNPLFNLDSGLIFQTGSITRSSTFTGNGSGVYNHNNGGTPQMCCPANTSASSLAAIGFSSATATQVYISQEFGNNFKVWCIGF